MTKLANKNYINIAIFNILSLIPFYSPRFSFSLTALLATNGVAVISLADGLLQAIACRHTLPLDLRLLLSYCACTA